MEQSNIQGGTRTPLALAYLAYLLAPTVITVLLLYVVHGLHFTQLMPAGPDGVFYWREPAMLARVGFDGGYTTAAEYVAPAAFSQFGIWGPVPPLVYSLFAVVRWPYYGIPFANLFLLTAAAGLLLAVTRPTLQRTLALTALFATFSANIIYGAVAMQTLMQQAIAVAAAASILYLLQHRAGAPLWSKLLIAALFAVMSVAKTPWAVLWLPYFLLISPRISLKSAVISLGLAGVMAVGAALAYRWLTPPYPYVIGTAAEGGPGGMVEALWRIAAHNLSLFNSGAAPEIHMRWLTVALIALGGGIVYLRRRRGADTRNISAAIIVITLSATLVMTVVLYEVQYFRDYRVIAPPVFIALILITLKERRGVVLGAFALQALALPYTLAYYAQDPEITQSEVLAAQVAEWKPVFAEHIHYLPDAPSPWCNTVLVSADYIFDKSGMIIALDERMGASLLILQGEFHFPIKSRYVLVDDAVMELIWYQVRLEPLMDVPDGKLYLNLDSVCA